MFDYDDLNSITFSKFGPTCTSVLWTVLASKVKLKSLFLQQGTLFQCVMDTFIYVVIIIMNLYTLHTILHYHEIKTNFDLHTDMYQYVRALFIETLVIAYALSS